LQESGITEQTYYRWRKEFGGLQVDQARRLKELEQEDVRRTLSVMSNGVTQWIGRLSLFQEMERYGRIFEYA
jgi:hypothetical protein